MSPLAAPTTPLATMTRIIAAPPSADHGVGPVPSASSSSIAPVTMNHTVGPVSSQARAVNPAIPAIDPPMSIAYARSGDIDRSSGPSGSARDAISPATSTISNGRTTKFTSALVEFGRPSRISPASRAWMLSCAPYTSRTVARSSGANGDRTGRTPRRPSRMPTPIPRKLAISRELLKNPTYLTFAGIQRMSSSSTNRSDALVRNRRTREPANGPTAARGRRGSASRTFTGGRLPSCSGRSRAAWSTTADEYGSWTGENRNGPWASPRGRSTFRRLVGAERFERSTS